jgi:hypothetical protein
MAGKSCLVRSHHAHVLITRVLTSVRLSLCLWCLQDRWAQQVSVAKRFQCNQPNATPVGWPPLQDSAPLCWGGLMLAAQRSPCAGPRGYKVPTLQQILPHPDRQLAVASQGAT